jgi:hypothetical protein
VRLDEVRVAGGRVFPTAPPVGLSYGGVGEGGAPGRLGAPRPPRSFAEERGYAAFVSQKIFEISSIWSSSFWPCAGSCDFFASPASFVAFQNSSCSCG